MKKLLILLILFGIVSCTVPKTIKDNPQYSSLINIISIEAGINCETGGIQLETGLDTDRNGILSQQEVLTVSYVCNGTNGEDGRDGFTPLINVVPIQVSELCETGGIRIEIGTDLNFNSVLETNEISYIEEICNGLNGSSTLIVTREDTEFCEDGGLIIEAGIDTNQNGTLEFDEIQNTSYVCNGEDGDKVLIRTEKISSGENCEFGGIVMYTGVDSNNNNTLDSSEIVTTDYICNGRDGFTTLSTFTTLPPTNGFNGGTVVDSGLDLNRDGVLQESEITSTYVILNGRDGLTSLIRLFDIQPNDQFPSGGIEIWSGVDLNSDGILTLEEATSISFITNGLNGVDGLNTLVNTVEQNNGTLVQIGLDDNRDGILQNSEIDETFFISNGVDGQDGDDGLCALVIVTEELPGDNCEFGGLKIETGKDRNVNGILDANEVLSVNYICKYGCQEESSDVHIGFENFDTGDIVSHINVDGDCSGVICVFGKNPHYSRNHAMIFDSNNPTGGDDDLGVNQGNILIVSEDGDQNDPDDLNDSRGYLVFDFLGFNATSGNNGNATVNSIDVIDMDNNSSAKIKLYDNDFNQIGNNIDIPSTPNKGVKTLDIGISGVAKMYVFLGGSGAVDNLKISCVTKRCD